MPTRRGTSRTVTGLTCTCTSPTTRADLTSPLSYDDSAPGLYLPRHLKLPCSTGLAAGQQSPGSRHMGSPSLPAQAFARGHPTAGNSTTSLQQHNKHCSQTHEVSWLESRRKPTASARRLPGPLQMQTSPPATQQCPRGIQTESCLPPCIFQLSGPAHSAQAHSVVMQSLSVVISGS
jgi:hypothetical protein